MAPMRLFPFRLRRLRVGPASVVTCWLTCVVAGFALAWRYTSASGPTARAPQRLASVAAEVASSTGSWPVGVARLLVFVHPRCPCSRATIEELDRIVAHTRSRAAVRVYVLAASASDDAWQHCQLSVAARAIPGVEVMPDVRGSIARGFGVGTSGTTLCYCAAGELLFQGGITGERGHVGDNAGADAVVDALLGEPVPISAAPTYGCPLFDDAAPPAPIDERVTTETMR